MGGFGLPLPPASSQFVVVGLTKGLPFTENPCLASQVAWARTNGKPSEALDLCRKTSFSGGRVYVSQWYDDVRDYDLTCGNGWNGFNALETPGDFNGTGGWLPRVKAGPGWNGLVPIF